jgi:hypothetical protein
MGYKYTLHSGQTWVFWVKPQGSYILTATSLGLKKSPTLQLLSILLQLSLQLLREFLHRIAEPLT